MDYPATRVEDRVDTLHGFQVRDPYRWLEDGRSPEVRSWLEAQDALTRAYLDDLPGREALRSRLRELYYTDAIGIPIQRGSRLFYGRTHRDREKGILYWREGEEERVLIDPNQLSRNGSVSLGTWVPSWDGERLAYALRENNSDEAALHVMDVASGEVSVVDVIPGAKYAVPSWTPQGDGFYYVFLPESPDVSVADRPGTAEIRFHRLGTEPKADPVVHPATGDAQSFLGVDLSRDGRWLLASIQHGWNATDVWFRDLHSKPSSWVPLAVGLGANVSVDVWGDRFLVRTNDGAPRYRVFRVDPARPDRRDWRDVIPESEAVIEVASFVGGHIGLLLSVEARSELEVRDLNGALVRRVPLPGIGTASHLVGEAESDSAYFSFNSFTQPTQVFRTSIASGETSVWSEVKLPIDPSRFEVEQVRFPSKDGTPVSMFVVSKRGAPRDGSMPFILYGYGGFNISVQSSFVPYVYPWLEGGGGYAVANLRGGGEYGEAWHQAGMGVRKQNVFDDFIGAAEFLVRERYTQPKRLAIRGGSNGGLLVGAAMTQRPELFGAVICAVPLLDMVRYHLFGSGKTWIPEYGSAEDPEELKAILEYSPYHHLADGTRYPPTLMLTADSDDRVDPLHARKMIAQLQRWGSGGPYLLRLEKNAGHTGADMVKQMVEQNADVLAFLMNR